MPNDLLNEIDRMRFHIPELAGEGEPIPLVALAQAERQYRPIVVITSSSEKVLPEPFLRRCVYHHLTLPPFREDPEAEDAEVTIESIVWGRLAARFGGDGGERRFAELMQLFRFLRRETRGLERSPGLAELLVWLLALVPAVLLAVLWVWRRLRRQAVLRQRKGDAGAPLHHLTLDADAEDIFTGAPPARRPAPPAPHPTRAHPAAGRAGQRRAIRPQQRPVQSDWLRLALRERLDRRTERRIVRLYRELLLKVSVDGDEAVRLPLAVPPPREPWPARLRRLLRDKPWRLSRQLRDWAATAPAETLLADRIFLHTVVRPRVLDLLLPRALRNLMSRRLARPLPPPAEGKARPLAAAAALVLLILTGHWAWQGSGRLVAAGLDMGLSGQAAALWIRANAGLRGWAHDRLLARQLAPNQGCRVEIRYRPAGPDPRAPDPQANRDLGLALTAALLGQAGFTDITLIPLETLDAAQDTPTQRSAGAQAAAATPQAALNSIQIGADAALPAAEQVQAQLRHLA